MSIAVLIPIVSGEKNAFPELFQKAFCIAIF